MKCKSFILTFTLVISSFLSALYAQDRSEMSNRERDRLDSLDTISKNEAQAQKNRDEVRMADAKHERKQTKVKEKDAERIERDASKAAKESRYAVRSERKAQKSRKQANKQADKASKARDKSDKN